jgi:hypothetical protein
MTYIKEQRQLRFNVSRTDLFYFYYCYLHFQDIAIISRLFHFADGDDSDNDEIPINSFFVYICDFFIIYPWLVRFFTIWIRFLTFGVYSVRSISSTLFTIIISEINKTFLCSSCLIQDFISISYPGYCKCIWSKSWVTILT